MLEYLEAMRGGRRPTVGWALASANLSRAYLSNLCVRLSGVVVHERDHLVLRTYVLEHTSIKSWPMPELPFADHARKRLTPLLVRTLPSAL